MALTEYTIKITNGNSDPTFVGTKQLTLADLAVISPTGITTPQTPYVEWVSDTTTQLDGSVQIPAWKRSGTQYFVLPAASIVTFTTDIADEAIFYQGLTDKFANVKLNYKVDQELLDEFNEEYNKIYNYFGFYDTIQATDYFRKWLIDGFLAFEIVYNKEQTEIIGFVELDPAMLTPGIDPQTNEKVWFVNQQINSAGQTTQDRILYDSQIIYLSYAKADTVSRISYVERLIRDFNILRTMEATRIIWAVTNASYKTQYIIHTEFIAPTAYSGIFTILSCRL